MSHAVVYTGAWRTRELFTGGYLLRARRLCYKPPKRQKRLLPSAGALHIRNTPVTIGGYTPHTLICGTPISIGGSTPHTQYARYHRRMHCETRSRFAASTRGSALLCTTEGTEPARREIVHKAPSRGVFLLHVTGAIKV